MRADGPWAARGADGLAWCISDSVARAPAAWLLPTLLIPWAAADGGLRITAWGILGAGLAARFVAAQVIPTPLMSLIWTGGAGALLIGIPFLSPEPTARLGLLLAVVGLLEGVRLTHRDRLRHIAIPAMRGRLARGGWWVSSVVTILGLGLLAATTAQGTTSPAGWALAGMLLPIATVPTLILQARSPQPTSPVDLAGAIHLEGIGGVLLFGGILVHHIAGVSPVSVYLTMWVSAVLAGALGDARLLPQPTRTGSVVLWLLTVAVAVTRPGSLLLPLVGGLALASERPVRKGTAWSLGPGLLSAVVYAEVHRLAGDHRPALASLAIFFGIGWVLHRAQLRRKRDRGS